MEYIELHDVPDEGIADEFINEIGLNHFYKNEYELELYGSPKLLAKFHNTCDKNRFRQMPSEIWQGLRVSSFLTLAGIEIKLLPTDWDFRESKVGILAKKRRLLMG